ncbi:MAG: N-acyl homoserine lactonase family protein [Proteobacteria bacterium]|nr:N-acyl homoserine lactonase family protein [Pseudomonadota bacterium]
MATTTSQAPAAVERLYDIDCGENRTADLSPWTTPADKGKPYAFANNCYLIKHAKGWMLWDSGHPDRYASIPEGVPNQRRTSIAVMNKPLTQSLREIGVVPADISFFAMSHSHADHTGNANLFAGATIFMQQAEYDAAFGPEPQRFGFNPANYDQLRSARIVKLHGDHDVFGDGSVVIKSTPGHTPGHQSLFVRLPKSAPVLLSGDFVHLRANWDAMRVPSINFDQAQSLKSMQEMDAFLKQTGARLWINHDAEQARTIPKAPAYSE